MSEPRYRMSDPMPQPGTLCKRFGALLPLAFQDGLLDDEAPETEAWREHLAGCAYCQSMLAHYQTQEDWLRRTLNEQAVAVPSHAATILERLQEEPIVSELPELPTPEQQPQRVAPDPLAGEPRRPDREHPAAPRRKRQVHPVIAWLAPVAAVLLVALLAAALFTTLHRSGATPTGTPAPTPAAGPMSLISMPGIPWNNDSRISFTAVSMLSSTEGWAIAGTSNDMCSICAPGRQRALILRDHKGVWSILTFPELHDGYVDDHDGNWKPTDYVLSDLSAVSPTDVWITTSGPVSDNGRVAIRTCCTTMGEPGAGRDSPVVPY
jgi:hypothetical protein